MKKFTLISVIAAAAMFAACSDDSSSSPSGEEGGNDGKEVVSCDVQRNFGGVESHECTEIDAAAPEAEAFKTACGESLNDKVVNTIGTGCASGAELKCPVGSTTYYFYDEGMGGFDCDMMVPAEM